MASQVDQNALETRNGTTAAAVQEAVSGATTSVELLQRAR